MPRILLSSALLALLLLGSACSKLTQVLKEPDVNRRYEAALAYYEGEDYGRAGIVFEDLIPDIYGKTMAEKVQFYYAYCHYHQKQYELAGYYFKTFHNTYQRSPFAVEALFMSAYSTYLGTPVYNLDQSNTGNAIEALQDFINRYPDSNYVPQATAAIRELRAKLERKGFEVAKQYQRLRMYKSAVIAYDTFRKNFPDSQFKEEALFRRIVCQSELAKVSYDHLRVERYEELLDFYLKFVDRYPQSPYLREAEDRYEDAQKRLAELRQAEAEAKKANP
jgi:outer membrane protein assembly factor BamD